MTIKEEVLKSYPGAECILTGTGYYIKSHDLETPFCDEETHAWARFKVMYCKDELISSQLQLPIIGKEYEFKSYNNWVKRKFGGFVGIDTNNNHVHYKLFQAIPLAFKLMKVTHWQPIIKPLNPIY